MDVVGDVMDEASGKRRLSVGELKLELEVREGHPPDERRIRGGEEAVEWLQAAGRPQRQGLGLGLGQQGAC